MHSIDAQLEQVAHSRFLSPRFDSVTPWELLAILKRSRKSLNGGGRPA